MSLLEEHPEAQTNRELYGRWKEARSTWDTEARKDIEFFLGSHFTQEESDEMASRNQADVPMDRISPAVEKFTSMLTARSPAFTVVGREDSDVKQAKVWRTVLGYNWEISEGDVQIKQALQDYSTAGLGYVYAFTDNKADFGRGDVKFKYVDPFRVYLPPSCKSRWGDDAESIILSTILTGGQLVGMYPELGDQMVDGEIVPGIINDIDVTMENDYPSSQNKNSMQVFTPAEAKDLDSWDSSRYQVLERFYKVTVPFYRILYKDQEFILDEMGFSSFLEENGDVFALGLADFEEVLQERVAVSATVGQIKLYETVLNTDIYPIIPFPNIWTGTIYPKSDVSRARPMQRLLNKLWSLALSHAQASAGLKLIVPFGSAINGLEELEQQWANPNAVIEVDSSVGEPHYPTPQPLSAEFYRLIQQCEFYIDFIFGIPEMMHGFGDKAPETVRGTERMIALGSERPKSKLRDVEFSLKRLGRVLYNLDKGHYTYKKMFRLSAPSHDETMINYYDDTGEAVNSIVNDRFNIGLHDISVEPGSTLPTNKWAEFSVYLEMYDRGIVDDISVLAKHPEIYDKERIIQRKSMLAQAQQMINQLGEQVKQLSGDLDNTRRMAIQAQMRSEIEKFKGRLSEITSEAKADRRVGKNRLDSAVKLSADRLNLMEQSIKQE